MSTASAAAPGSPHLFWRCAALGNAGLAIAFVVLWVSMGLSGQFWRADFSGFYTGWSIVLDGQGDRLYDLSLQREYQQRLVPGRSDDADLLPFNYPPHAAIALSWLALLSRPVAFGLWTVLQVGMCVLGGRLVLRLLAEQSNAVRLLALASILAFPSVFIAFQLGQITLWCIVCQLGFLVALKEDRPFALGAWIALGTIKPHFMVVPVLVLLVLHRWRALAWLAGLLLPAVALATLVLGPNCWGDFLGLLRTCTEQFGSLSIDPRMMYNLKGVCTTALGSARADLINRLSAIAFLTGLLPVLALWRCSPRSPAFDARLALALLAGLLANPHVNPTDALALIPPAILFFRHLSRSAPRSAVAFGVLAVLCPLLFLVDCYLIDPTRLGARPFVLLWVGVAGWIGSTHLRSSPEPLCGKA